MTEADRLITETGLCLVWVPEAEVIIELLGATGKEQRDTVLVHNSERILASIERLLDDLTQPQLTALRGSATEALAVARAGNFGAAQTLAATILSAALEQHYGFSFGRARERFASEPPLNAGLFARRRALVQRSLELAFLKSRHRPPGAGFNRHITVHGTDLGHLSQPQALEALLLLGGTLRELQEIYRVAQCGFALMETFGRNASRPRPLPVAAQTATWSSPSFASAQFASTLGR